MVQLANREWSLAAGVGKISTIDSKLRRRPHPQRTAFSRLLSIDPKVISLGLRGGGDTLRLRRIRGRRQLMVDSCRIEK